jgi:hypothetical protein
MSALRFEWDPRKAAANLRKHGVSFGEAEEDRFVLLGVSATSRLVVCGPLLSRRRSGHPDHLRAQGGPH